MCFTSQDTIGVRRAENGEKIKTPLRSFVVIHSRNLTRTPAAKVRAQKAAKPEGPEAEQKKQQNDGE
jgi:hypothetical protein